VIVIIDEYDKLILEYIGHDDIQMEIQEELASVYSVLKSNEEDIRLEFITGMYKFSQTSMFSSLNNLFDHTISLEAGCLFGYTESEILSYCPHQLEALKITMGLDSIYVTEWRGVRIIKFPFEWIFLHETKSSANKKHENVN
jgi:hypothetical protein